MPAAAFLAATYDSITDGGHAVLERHKGSKLKVAYEALTSGTRPSVDDQLEDADFRSPFKKTSGFRASLDNVYRLFEDLEGADLLEDWSNIEELRNLKLARLDARNYGATTRPGSSTSGSATSSSTSARTGATTSSSACRAPSWSRPWAPCARS